MKFTMGLVSLCRFWIELHQIFPNTDRWWDQMLRYRLTISLTIISTPQLTTSITIIIVCSIIWTRDWMNFIDWNLVKITNKLSRILSITIPHIFIIKHILLPNIPLQHPVVCTKLEWKLIPHLIVVKIWRNNWVIMVLVNKISIKLWIKAFLFKI